MPASELQHRKLTKRVIGAFYEVYRELGIGFLESVYEGGMAVALGASGLRVVRQPAIQVIFRGVEIGLFRPDLLIEDRVIVELKVAKALNPIHEAQLLNYLKASRIEVGLLLNFGTKPQFRRMFLTRSPKIEAGRLPIANTRWSEEDVNNPCS